jgi:hypothetical protein
MRRREFLDQRAAFALRQLRFQFVGEFIDGLLAGLECRPVLVEFRRILAAQQRVFPLLHLKLECDERGRNHSLVRDVVLHGDAVCVDRLVERVNAV